MKHILLITVAGLLLPPLAYATDARMSYTTPAGTTQALGMLANVCGTNSDGTPTSCVTGDTAQTQYTDLAGTTRYLGYIVPVCSVEDGVPQVCNFGGDTPDLSAYLTTAAAADTYATLDDMADYITRSEKGVPSGVATLDPSGAVMQPINTTEASKTGALTVTGNIAEQGIPTFTSTSGQVTGALTGSTAKWQISRSSSAGYTSLSTYASGKWVPFMFNDNATVSTTVGTLANLGADVEFTKTLTVDGVTSVPDTTTADSSKSALNTESAAARFVSNATAASTYETIAGMSSYALATNGTLTTPTITKPSIDGGKLTTDGNGNWIMSGNNGIKFGNLEWLNYNAADGYIAVNGDLEITGRVNLPTRTTGDNGNFAASTAFVQNTVNAMQGSVTGDLSASGSSLTMPVGSSGLNLVMSYSSSGVGALTAVSASGTLSPVDIYETAAWGTTSFKGYTLDSGTITTTATTVDGTFYLTSNAWGTYHIGVGGHLYIVDIFGSGAGKRTFMSWRMVK